MKLKYVCELVRVSPHFIHVISFPSLNLVKQMKKQTLSSMTCQTFVQRPCTRTTEAEEIMKRWQEHREELYKKDLNDLDNHYGVFTHLETDIL